MTGAPRKEHEDELAALIAEQEKDMRTGHRVFTLSLDASHGSDNGFSLADLAVADDSGSVGRLVGSVRRTGRVRVSDDRHGTTNGYNNLGCRCAKCREAWRIYMRSLTERHERGIPSSTGYTPHHGTFTRYLNWKCRCLECSVAAAEHRIATGQTRSSRLIVVRFAKVVATTHCKVELPPPVRLHHSYKQPVKGMCAGYLNLGPKWSGSVRCSRRAKRNVDGDGYCETHAKKAAEARQLRSAA